MWAVLCYNCLILVDKVYRQNQYNPRDIPRKRVDTGYLSEKVFSHFRSVDIRPRQVKNVLHGGYCREYGIDWYLHRAPCLSGIINKDWRSGNRWTQQKQGQGGKLYGWEPDSFVATAVDKEEHLRSQKQKTEAQFSWQISVVQNHLDLNSLEILRKI